MLILIFLYPSAGGPSFSCGINAAAVNPNIEADGISREAPTTPSIAR